MSDFSRRTVVRGAAWTVPVVAIAAQAPAFATSHEPPPPVVNFGGSCANTGAEFKGCGTDKTLQVPLTLSNPTPEDIVFQITSMYTCNCTTAPTGPGAGVYSGIVGIRRTNGHDVANHNVCLTAPVSQCGGGVANGSIVVPAGETNLKYWIVSAETGASSTFSSRISYRLLSADCQTVILEDEAFTSQAISPKNCGKA